MDQTAFEQLCPDYRAYIEQLRTAWLETKRVTSKKVLELMCPDERAEVDVRVAEWARHVTPLANAWWKERGYGVIWPADDTKPEQHFKLEPA